MTRDDTNRDLERLREACARITENLVELEIDSSRELLEASRLRGESAAAWSTASAALTELWRRQSLLEAMLKQADEHQRARRHEEARRLLRGRSIELSTADVPLSERELLGGSRTADRCTPLELIAGMSASFERVTDVIARIGTAWEVLMPKLDGARDALRQARQLANDLGEAERDDLRAAADRLDELTGTASADPLSASATDIDAFMHDVQTIRDELERTAAFKQGFRESLRTAHDLLERLRTAEHDGRAAHEELEVKISVPIPPRPPAAHEELELELDELTALGTRGAWREAQRALDAWTPRARALLDDARRALAANRAPLEARNQLRALLDAYQVKAQRLGLLEEPDVAEMFDAAHEALYRAPTDLAVAARLVRGYQQAINGPTSEAEATL
jgi:hypothetical protein